MFRLVTPLEPLSEFQMPMGTVTVVIDRDKGTMDIFAEHECDPLDWDMACMLIQKMGTPGDLPEGDYLKGVDTWHVQLREHEQAS